VLPLLVALVGNTGAAELQLEMLYSVATFYSLYIAVSHLIKLAIFRNSIPERNT
jgi:hypothetical protein